MKTAAQPLARRKPAAPRKRASDGSDGLLPWLEGIPADSRLVSPKHGPVTARANLPAGGRDLEDALRDLCNRVEREVLLGTW